MIVGEVEGVGFEGQDAVKVVEITEDGVVMAALTEALEMGVQI